MQKRFTKILAAGAAVLVLISLIWGYASTWRRSRCGTTRAATARRLNEQSYGAELANHYDKHYREAISNRWLPDYAPVPWKMAIMAGHNPANWRASGTRWRQSVFEKLDTIVAMTPDMSFTALYADYVLPIAHHYERQDITMEGRTPYLQVLDQAVPPLGESVDDFTAIARLTGHK